jgi:hypothetical protein
MINLQQVQTRHSGESRNPELLKIAGFRVKHGMTKEGKIDFHKAVNDGRAIVDPKK